MISQSRKVSPPITSDDKLTDYSAIIQSNLSSLFLAAHIHIGLNGVLSTPPAKNQGNIGDILIGVVGGSAYLYFKTTASTWFRLGPAATI